MELGEVAATNSGRIEQENPKNDGQGHLVFQFHREKEEKRAQEAHQNNGEAQGSPPDKGGERYPFPSDKIMINYKNLTIEQKI